MTLPDPAPYVFADLELLDAAKVNARLNHTLITQPHIELAQSGTATSGTGAEAYIEGWATTKTNDPDATFLLNAGAYVLVKQPGIYLVSSTLALNANATGYRRHFIYSDTALADPAQVAIEFGQATSSASWANTLTRQLAFTAADVGGGVGVRLSVRAAQNSGATVATGACKLAVTRLGNYA